MLIEYILININQGNPQKGDFSQGWMEAKVIYREAFLQKKPVIYFVWFIVMLCLLIYRLNLFVIKIN